MEEVVWVLNPRGHDWELVWMFRDGRIKGWDLPLFREPDGTWLGMDGKTTPLAEAEKLVGDWGTRVSDWVCVGESWETTVRMYL